MFHQLKKIEDRPEPFEYYTAQTLWNDSHISKQMLAFHLNPEAEPASRNKTVIDKSLSWMTDRFNICQGVNIADFGCGPGLYTHAFAQKGATVVGIDFSNRSIDYARQHARKDNLDISYLNQNYLEFNSVVQFDLITLIYCDFCALSPEQRSDLLSIFHRHLKKDGVLFLDVFSMAAFHSRQESTVYQHLLSNHFWAENEYYGFQKTFKYNSENVVLDKFTIIEESKTWEVYNWLQYFSTASLTEEFSNNGFDIREIYSDVTGAPVDDHSDVFAVVAKKN